MSPLSSLFLWVFDDVYHSRWIRVIGVSSRPVKLACAVAMDTRCVAMENGAIEVFGNPDQRLGTQAREPS